MKRTYSVLLINKNVWAWSRESEIHEDYLKALGIANCFNGKNMTRNTLKEILDGVLMRLFDDGYHFRPRLDDGSYDDLLIFLNAVRDACKVYPDAHCYTKRE